MSEQQGGKRTRRDRVELSAAILIAFAAVLTAIATYQSGEQDGTVRELYTESLVLNSIANDTYNDANAQQAIERDWVFTWLIEYQNDEAAAGYLLKAMPIEVRRLIDEFLSADDNIMDPFSLEAAMTYSAFRWLPSSILLRTGHIRVQEADCAIFEGQIADDMGNNLDLSTVFLAISLVTAGLASLLHSRFAQNMVIVTAVVTLVLGASLLLVGGDYQSSRYDIAGQSYPKIKGAPGPFGLRAANLACPSHELPPTSNDRLPGTELALDANVLRDPGG